MDNPEIMFDRLVKRLDKKWRITSPKEYFITIEFFNDDGTCLVIGEGRTLMAAIVDVEGKL